VPTTLAYNYAPGDFYLTIDRLDAEWAYLTLHGTTNGLTYELFSTTNLQPAFWVPEQLFLGQSNQTYLPNGRFDRSPLFFQATRGWTDLVSIYAGTNAIAPFFTNDPGEIGYFIVQRTNVTSTPLTVRYYVRGTASNGCHYSSLSGTVTIPANTNIAIVVVQPITNCFVFFEETVTLTLAPTNGYFIDPTAYSATVFLENNPRIFQRVVAKLNDPVGIDYHPPTQSLIVTTGSSNNTNNFMQIYANIVFSNSLYVTNVVVTNWTDLTQIPDEVKIAIAKSSSDGFTNGDLFFGDNTDVGWIGASGTNYNRHWGVLTNASLTNAFELRGSLHFDQTGVFSNNLVVVTGNGGPLAANYGVWRIDANRHAHLITEIFANHLEGAITVTNNSALWGPWAGKLITGDEHDQKIFAVDHAGATITYELGINPEDFDIVPANQDLYCTDVETGNILKIPRTLLASYTGQMIITQAGEGLSPRPGSRLFFVRWDGTNFQTRNVRHFYTNSPAGHFEHVSFAPIDLPPIPE
jgi:hypothetical protein